MRPNLALLLLPAALAPAAPAQRATIDPVPFEWTAGARETGFPFGHPERRRVRYLQVHDGMAGRPRSVSGVAFRRSAATAMDPVPAFTADLAMRLSTAARTATSIASTFADNVGADVVTVLPRRTVSFPPSAGSTTDPAPFDYLIPADVPFAFAGAGPLCIDLTVYDHGNAVPARFDLHAEGYSHLGEIGPGCDGLQLATQLAFPTAVHTVSGAPANGPIVLLLGASFDTVAGVPLPLDLAPLGAPGCSLHLEPALGVPGLADPSGSFETTVPVGVAPQGAYYGAQAVAVQPGLNALGAITSNATVVVPWSGRVVGRVWSDNPDATDGLRQPVFGLVVELR